MVADLIETERQASAYALLRMSNNLGVAIGPSVGGFAARLPYVHSLCIGMRSLDEVRCNLALLEVKGYG
jgi:hypothetical protein